jgi:hypothetical protein
MVKQTDPFNEPPSGLPSPFDGLLFVVAILGTAFAIALIVSAMP